MKKLFVRVLVFNLYDCNMQTDTVKSVDKHLFTEEEKDAYPVGKTEIIDGETCRSVFFEVGC